MAIKFTQTGYAGAGGGGGTYDHNLLINRGLPDQHTIESITGLRTALNAKYQKPFTGIPKTDLAFDVATLYDLEVLRSTYIADISAQMQAIAEEVQEARGGEDRLKKYIDTKVSYSEWSGGTGGGAGGGHVESQVGYPLYQEIRAVDHQTTFQLDKTFRKGTRQLEVLLNGLRMVQDDDYRELTDSSVEFLFELNEDDLVVFQVRAVINSGLHEEYIATEGQTVFPLTSPYGIGQNILQVYRNGVLQRKGRDYKEIDNMTVHMQYGMMEDDYMTFHQAGATDPIAGTLMESELGRLKINLGYTTMMLHDATKTANTDYRDMYVDTFITDASIDKARSFQYLFENEGIEVRPITSIYDTTPDFATGIFTDTDSATFPGHIIMKNFAGGAIGNSFGEGEVLATAGVTDSHSFYNKLRQLYYFYIETTANDSTLRYTMDGGAPVTLCVTDGLLLQITAEQDSAGNIHVVCTDVPAAGKSKIHYWKIDALTAEVNGLTASDVNYDSINADFDIDQHDVVHMVFSSKRINSTYLNLDYITISGGAVSSIKNLTAYTAIEALNPKIAVGKDDKARVVFETIEFDDFTKNIKVLVLNNGVVETAKFITQSTTYVNVTPDIDIDSLDILKIVWRSKRLGATYGIEYCTMSPTNIIGGVISVSAGLFDLGRPRIAVDYENISHIVFDGNVTRDDHQNLCYAFVYPDGTLNPIEDIRSAFGFQFRDPDINIYGDRAVVSYLQDDNGGLVTKLLTNYSGMGRYDITVDSKTPDSEWMSIVLDRTAPDGSSISLEYRIGNDGVSWTTWRPQASLSTETEIGRYLQIRITLQSTQPTITPDVNQISVTYMPTFIEVQSVPKASQKDVDSVIVIARYEGDVAFAVSRDDGVTWVDATLEAAVNLATKPIGNTVIVKAKIPTGARLDAWASLW